MGVLCLRGADVAQWSLSHTSGSHVVIVQGRQAPSHPAPSQQSLPGGLWGVTACQPSITLGLTGPLEDVHSRASTHECEQPKGWN